MKRWRFLGALALGLVLTRPLAADFMPAPWIFSNCHEITNGSIVGAAQNVAFTFNQGAKMWCLLNPANQTEQIFWRLTGTATTTSGANGEVSPGMMMCWGGSGIVQNPAFPLSVNAATNPHPYYALECQ